MLQEMFVNNGLWLFHLKKSNRRVNHLYFLLVSTKAKVCYAPITSELFCFIVCFSYHNSWALVQTTELFYLFKTCFALEVKGCQGS